VGENLGTVPPEIDEALPRHRIWGMYLAEFQASSPDIEPPAESEMALVGTHDTPPFAGWVEGVDIGERIRHGLLAADAEAHVREERARAARRLADHLGVDLADHRAFLSELLAWLGRSDSPLVVPWLEDLWLEDVGVNLPGTRSSERPNWQRPMGRLLDDVFSDPEIDDLLRRLDRARSPE
jgi:4-alpha-glucanotransferase